MVGCKFELKGNTSATQWEVLLDCLQRIIVMIKSQEGTKAECFSSLFKWFECFISSCVLLKLEFKWIRQKAWVRRHEDEAKKAKFWKTHKWQRAPWIINTWRYLYPSIVNYFSNVFLFFIIANACILYIDCTEKQDWSVNKY